MKAPLPALRVTGHGRRGLAYVTEGPVVRIFMLRRIQPGRQVRCRSLMKGRASTANGKPTSGRDRGSPQAEDPKSCAARNRGHSP